MNKNKTEHPNSIFKITASLTLIAVVVALALGFTHMLTRERIEKNQTKKTRQAMAEIFPVAERFAALNGIPGLNGEKVYAAVYSNAVIGFCVELCTQGFGSEDMQLMVGVNPDYTVAGVQVLSHSETPGVGSQVTDPEFLRQFYGLGGTIELGRGLDAVSGATVSSKAVVHGLNRAITVGRFIDDLSEIFENSDRNDNASEVETVIPFDTMEGQYDIQSDAFEKGEES